METGIEQQVIENMPERERERRKLYKGQERKCRSIGETIYYHLYQ